MKDLYSHAKTATYIVLDHNLLLKEGNTDYFTLLSQIDYQKGYTFVRVAIPLILCMKFRATLSATIILYAVPAGKAPKK